MAEFKNDDLGVRFTVPDKLTVRQQLKFRGRVYSAGASAEDIHVRFWLGASGLVEEWECDALPDPLSVDLDTETNPDVANILHWVGNAVAGHISGLGDVEKN